METRGTSPASAANFRMIDVGEKIDTHRRALASGYFEANSSTIDVIMKRKLPKGDALVLAEVAGIQAAKNASHLLPLCHPLALTSVQVKCSPENESKIRVTCEVKTVGKTGVEMEALAGVSAALLCIYDLTKMIDPVLKFGGIQLEEKDGGKSGQWRNPNVHGVKQKIMPIFSSDTPVSVITMSDRAHQGKYEDRSGPAISDWFKNNGVAHVNVTVLPDEASKLIENLSGLVKCKYTGLVVISGGTGISKRDITPDVLISFAEELRGRQVPGIGERLRSSGARYTPFSWLSRSVSVVVDQLFILSLPGSPKAVLEGLNELKDVLPHVLKMLKEEPHHD